MPTSYTSLLGLALPATGELNNTWGDVVNASITSLLDSAISGSTALTTDADVTLTIDQGASNTARQAILLCTGARTAVRNVTAPAQSKAYIVVNATTGGYAVNIRGVGPTSGVQIPAASRGIVVWNGSDFVLAAVNPVSGALTNAYTPPVAVTFSATAMTVNCNLSNVFDTTFTANVTVAPTISNPNDGQTINWFITQDGTGGHTMTWPASFKWPSGTPGVLSTPANSVDLLVATYRSATGFWYATLSKAFS